MVAMTTETHEKQLLGYEKEIYKNFGGGGGGGGWGGRKVLSAMESGGGGCSHLDLEEGVGVIEHQNLDGKNLAPDLLRGGGGRATPHAAEAAPLRGPSGPMPPGHAHHFNGGHVGASPLTALGRADSSPFRGERGPPSPSEMKGNVSDQMKKKKMRGGALALCPFRVIP